MSRRRWTGATLALAMAFTGLGLTTGAQADSRDDLVSKQEEQERQIESVQSSLEGVDTELQDVYLQLQQTETQIPIAEQELADAEAELAAAERDQQIVAGQLEAAQGELSSIQQEITDGEAEIESTRNNLGEIARAQYRGDTVPTTMELLVGSSSSEDFLNSYATWEALSRTQSSTLTDVEVATARNQTREARQSDVESQIAELKQQADDLVAEKTNKQATAKDKKDSLTALQSEYDKQSKDLEDQRDAFQANLATLDQQRNDTAAEIAKIDEENRKKEEAARAAAAQAPANSGSSNANSGSPASSGVSNPTGAWLIPPVPAPVYVTSPFGMREYPFGGWWMHNGVDLRSPCGEAQVAPADGVVAKTVPAPGNSTHGNQVFINLGVVNGSSWVAVTNHLSGFNVSAGQSVRQGDVIGWTGQTGDVTGCHVHFEVWKDGSVVDPMGFAAFTQRSGGW